MARENAPLLAFNRGEVSKSALARVDVERMRLSAETQVNFLPTVLGPMMLRPGLGYRGGIRNDLQCRPVPFVFSNDDTAILECTDLAMRVWNVSGDTETLVTRPSVTSVVTNGDFSSGTGWTLTPTGSGAVADISGGVLTLASPAFGGLAQAKRSVTINQTGTEHAFRILVTRGPVLFRCGTTDGDDDVIGETDLDTGVHSLGFTTASGTVYIQIETRSAQSRIVDSITFEAAGVLALPTTWAQADLARLRYDQSGDVIFVACDGQQQRKIERRSTRSWSFVLYKSDDGPFGPPNVADTTLTPTVLTGNGTLTASRKLFRTTHVGALFRLFSTGQSVAASLGADDAFTPAIRVTGVDNTRIFNYALAGTWVGTLTLERSFDSETTGFSAVTTFTGNTTGSFDDTLDNSIVWYRFRFIGNTHTSGSVDVTLAYAGGSAAGVCRVVSYVSRTVVNIEVLDAFSSLVATNDWNEGEWSDLLGWPSSVAFHDGRLWWAGRDKLWGSVSDAYYSFNPDTAGDAGPINRSVGFGPVDTINWLLPLTRLVVGRQGAETSVRSGSQDEPLTPTTFTLKDCSTQGSSAVGAVKIDTRGVFVQQSGCRVYELVFSAEAFDYVTHDLTRLNPDIGEAGFSQVAVQRQPDTQLHFVRTDGQVAALVHDIEDEVECWWRVDTTGGVSGEIEAVVILPGIVENRVYYAVKRTIGGVTKRYLEKLALRSQCNGRATARCSDSHIVYTGGTTTVTGLSHLEGAEVVAWGWNDGGTQGDDCGTGLDDTGVMRALTVVGGTVTIPESFDNVCVGLPYEGRFKSAKLAYAAQRGTPLNQKKKLNRVGLSVTDTHHMGLRFGGDFSRMDNLPAVIDGADVAAGAIHQDLDLPMLANPSGWSTDSRLCLLAASPRPAKAMAVVVDVSTNEG